MNEKFSKRAILSLLLLLPISQLTRSHWFDIEIELSYSNIEVCRHNPRFATEHQRWQWTVFRIVITIVGQYAGLLSFQQIKYKWTTFEKTKQSQNTKLIYKNHHGRSSFFVVFFTINLGNFITKLNRQRNYNKQSYRLQNFASLMN